MKDYDGGTLYASSEGIDLSKRTAFDIGKLCAYIKEQRKKGRNPEDITQEELKPFIIKKGEIY